LTPAGGEAVTSWYSFSSQLQLSRYEEGDGFTFVTLFVALILLRGSVDRGVALVGGCSCW
jgi:hypothetical protein